MDSSQLTRHKRDRYSANALNGVTPRPIYPLDEEKRIGYKQGSKIVTYNKRTVLPSCTGPTCNEDLLEEPQGTVVFDTMTTLFQRSGLITYVAVDSIGNIYWVESVGTLPVTGYKIYKRDISNLITDVFTFNDYGGNPVFSQIVVDNDDNLYFFNNINGYGFCLAKMSPIGVVSHFTNTIIYQPVNGVTINKDNGDIYCVSPSACSVYKTNISGIVPVKIAGNNVGYYDSSMLLSNFNVPIGITLDKQNNFLYITEVINFDIRKIDLNTNTVSTYSSTAGSMPNPSGGTGPTMGNTVNVDRTLATFMRPTDIEIDSYGNLYICDSDVNQIKKIDSSGFVTVFAGSGASAPILDGPPLTAATFSGPNSVFIRSPTEMYVADQQNGAIRKITGSYQ